MSDEHDRTALARQPGERVEFDDGAPEPAPPAEPKLGAWYWVTTRGRNDEDERWFGCLVELGSNYALLENVNEGGVRIHFDEFHEHCELEPDPDAYINQQVGRYQAEIRALRVHVNELSRRLGIPQRGQLASGGETSALAVRGAHNPDMKAYSKELVLAKEKTLPELFEQMRKASKVMATWLCARTLPLKAEAGTMEEILDAVKSRIFNVQLYSGLTENAWLITEGVPAPAGTKIHVLQRRHYMDEECLINYSAGGMEFDDIHDFDKWLAKPENRDRLLPFPRTLLAFRVRRENKERGDDLHFWIKMNLEKADKRTFLYIRNGEQLYCMETEIEFDEKMFPDVERQLLNGNIFARMEHGSVKEIIPDHVHDAEVAERKAYDKLSRKKKEAHPRHREYDWERRKFVRYDQDTVYFDDITKHIQDEVGRHNRLVLVLQGILDRSPMLNPHPGWQLWKQGVLEEALELVYDDSRALTPGAAPDFEAYMAELGKLIKPGTVVMGQEPLWAEAMAKNAPRYYWKHGYPPDSYWPDGNPGPGELARVVKVSRSGECLFEWYRARRGFRRDPWVPKPRERLPCKFTAPRERLFNVSAYKPGDYKRFFADPRTRADYLKWAPFMLMAEDYHAGKLGKNLAARLAGSDVDDD